MQLHCTVEHKCTGVEILSDIRTNEALNYALLSPCSKVLVVQCLLINRLFFSQFTAAVSDRVNKMTWKE